MHNPKFMHVASNLLIVLLLIVLLLLILKGLNFFGVHII